MRRIFGIFCCCVIQWAVALNGALCDSSLYIDTNVDTNISLTENTRLWNYGTINGTIQTNGHDLDVYNFGYIGENIEAGTGFVRQYVTSDNALNKVSLNSEATLYVYIDNLNNVQLTNIKNLGEAEFNITNSVIVINDFADWQNWNQKVFLDNTDTLIVTNPDSVQSGQVINHVKGPIRIIVKDLDRTYKVELSKVADVYFINITREVDYIKDLKDERGVLLQAIRNANPNDRLLLALDRASTLEELEYILASSYRFNPSVLMKPVKTLNGFTLMNMMQSENTLYSGLSGVYIIADKTNAYGLDINVNGKYESVHLSAGFSIKNFEYKDDFNDFDGQIYGFNLKAKTYFDDFWVRGHIGASIVKFHTDDMLYDNSIKNSPIGFSGYGAVNLGYDYQLYKDFILSPFVGTSLDLYRIFDINDTDYGVHGGSNIEYSFVTDNIRYEYKGTSAITVNGDLYGALNVGFMSEVDNAGVSIGFDVLKTKDETGYKISVNGNIAF